VTLGDGKMDVKIGTNDAFRSMSTSQNVIGNVVPLRVCNAIAELPPTTRNLVAPQPTLGSPNPGSGTEFGSNTNGAISNGLKCDGEVRPPSSRIGYVANGSGEYSGPPVANMIKSSAASDAREGSAAAAQTATANGCGTSSPSGTNGDKTEIGCFEVPSATHGEHEGPLDSGSGHWIARKNGFKESGSQPIRQTNLPRANGLSREHEPKTVNGDGVMREAADTLQSNES
jgi:hypothetical protein